MRFSAVEMEILDKAATHYPQIKSILKDKLEKELIDLLQAGKETIQVHQGRCQLLKELLIHLDDEAANRPAKRTVTQPYTQ